MVSFYVLTQRAFITYFIFSPYFRLTFMKTVSEVFYPVHIKTQNILTNTTFEGKARKLALKNSTKLHRRYSFVMNELRVVDDQQNLSITNCPALQDSLMSGEVLSWYHNLASCFPSQQEDHTRSWPLQRSMLVQGSGAYAHS